MEEKRAWITKFDVGVMTGVVVMAINNVLSELVPWWVAIPIGIAVIVIGARMAEKV